MLIPLKKKKNCLEKGREKLSGNSGSDRDGGRRDNDLGGNYNADNSGYSKIDDFNPGSQNTGTGKLYSNENVGSGFQGQDSTRASQAGSYGDSGNLFDQSRGGEYGSTGLSGQRNAATEGFGARAGVSSRGLGDNQDSVSSGGYGTNEQGDSYSRQNQSGFDNEYQGNTGY